MNVPGGSTFGCMAVKAKGICHMVISRSVFCAMAFALAGCGGGSSIPEGKAVEVPGFDTYRTGHNDRNRVTRTTSDPADSADTAVLAAFDSGAGPAGYKDLIAVNDANMTVEVIAEVGAGPEGDKANRILRLTVDQIPLENIKDGMLVAASGKYFFRGQSYAWVTIDGGPLLSGYHDQGLETMEVDFGAGTVSLDVRTEVSPASDVEIMFLAQDLPFNITTGAFGGAVTIAVRNPDITATYAVDGSLRGNVGGAPVYTDGAHGLTTSGLFTASGATSDGNVTVDGVFLGADPNAGP